MSRARLGDSCLGEADLRGAELWRTDVRGADLDGANLRDAHLVATELDDAGLSGCSVFGISGWALGVNYQPAHHNGWWAGGSDRHEMCDCQSLRKP
jgi:uncharacterized protein YjbI with pentapeptide repeats